MNKIILLFMLVNSFAFSQDFQVTLKWNEMVGDAEGILQYYNQGKMEAIRGNTNKESSDGNISVIRTLTEGKQDFIIKNSKDKLINVWLINPLVAEELIEEEDYYKLSSSDAEAIILDNINNQSYTVKIPAEAKGLVFRAGVIIDHQFYPVAEMYNALRFYSASLVDAISGEAVATG